MISPEPVEEVRTQTVDELRRMTFLRLMKEYQAALGRLAAGYVMDAADREDLFQEIATAIWQAIPGFRGDAGERTWLYRVAHNTAITAAAKVWRRSRSETGMEGAPEPC